MSTRHGAGTCRWAVPTLFMAAPTWMDAEARPWTCLRDQTPRELDSTEACRTCATWEPRDVAPDQPVHTGARPYFLDIFSN
jgi:hypothetical protein